MDAITTEHDGAAGPAQTEPAPAPTAAPRRREPRTISPRGTPVAEVEITLHTEFAQRVYRRVWDRLKADLYVLTVRTRALAQEEAAAAIETTISEAFEKTRTDLSMDLQRTEHLRDHVKVTRMPRYQDKLTAMAEFSTPRAWEFLVLIQQMDQLLMLYDSLWLSGFATTDERVHRSQNWQRRLTKVANRLRELGNRTRVTLARVSERANGATDRPQPGGESVSQDSASPGGPDSVQGENGTDGQSPPPDSGEEASDVMPGDSLGELSSEGRSDDEVHSAAAQEA
jgi:hypothetical protein